MSLNAFKEDDLSGMHSIEENCFRQESLSGNYSNNISDVVDHVLQAQVIPQLLSRLNRKQSLNQISTPAEFILSEKFLAQNLERFSSLVLRNKISEACSIIDLFCNVGGSLETVFLELLAPAANIYGQGWVDDDCDFTEVTVGCWRLQQLMQRYSDDFSCQASSIVIPHQLKIWLSAAPGEQHTFGVSMLREFFIRAGCVVQSALCVSAIALLNKIKVEHFDVIALSISGEESIVGLKNLLNKLRNSSINQNVKILVGGQAINSNPLLCEQIGADLWAKDAHEALSALQVLSQTICC
jgi:MerR family transcriptional regulator, light-induced transcriptional regulator